MNNKATRQIIHGILAVIGLGIIIAGIIIGKPGSFVVGIVVSGVNAQQWIKWNTKEKFKKAT